MPGDRPRRYKAAYAGSMAAELKKNVQLDPGEEIVFSASVQIRRNWLLVQPGVLALTPHRLILLEHFLLSPDWILEISRAATVNLSFDQEAGSRWLDISYIGPNSTDIVTPPASLDPRPSFIRRILLSLRLPPDVSHRPAKFQLRSKLCEAPQTPRASP